MIEFNGIFLKGDKIVYFFLTILRIPKASEKHPIRAIIILHIIPEIANIIGSGHTMATIRNINPTEIIAMILIMLSFI